MDISSASNSQVTLLRKLNRKKYRRQEQLFLLEGARAVEQVLENKAVQLNALFFDEHQVYWQQNRWKEFSSEINSYFLTAELFAEVTDTDTPQGVLALCEIPEEAGIDELTQKEGLVIALDGVQDPGNLGTIIRTASWFGANGMLSGKGTVDLFHPKVVRATAGATGVLPHRNGSLSEILPEFAEAGWPVYLLDAGTESQSLSEVESIDKAVIVVGNEAHGISSELRSRDRQNVRIDAPQKQTGVESLNAAVSASIALYDFSAKLT